MKVFAEGGEGPFVPFMGILQKAPPAPSPFFLIKIRNDRPERQRAKGAMAEIAPDPGNGLMQVGGGDPGADGRVRLDERGKVVANLEQRPILGIESVFIAPSCPGWFRRTLTSHPHRRGRDSSGGVPPAGRAPRRRGGRRHAAPALAVRRRAEGLGAGLRSV